MRRKIELVFKNIANTVGLGQKCFFVGPTPLIQQTLHYIHHSCNLARIVCQAQSSWFCMHACIVMKLLYLSVLKVAAVSSFY